MKRIAIRVDSKGRLLIPKSVREQLGIGKEVTVTLEDGKMTIEPVERIYERLATNVKFNFANIADEIPRLRKAAEEELFKRTS